MNELTPNARNLRKNMTQQERKLWNIIKNNQFYGYKFLRQYVIGQYIVDFICREKKIIIEIDGGQHKEEQNIIYDKQRTIFLENLGYKVVRFWNNDIDDNIEGVYQKLQDIFVIKSAPTLTLHQKGGNNEISTKKLNGKIFMKKFSVLLFVSVLSIFIFIQNPSQSIIITAENAQSAKIKTYNASIPYANYLKFYTIEDGRVQIHFNQMNEEVEKNYVRNLTKEEKQDYKYTKKIQQLIDKGAWGEVLYKYPTFYPALVQYYNNCLEKNLYEEALRTMDKIRIADRNYQIFSKNTINNELGSLYIRNKQYQKALDLFRLYENTANEKIYSSIAQCYYGMGDYQNALNYLGRIRNKKYEDNELLYTIYLEKNDIVNAHKTAISLNNQKYNFENLMRIQKTSQNDADRLKYAYQARNTTMNEADIAMVNKTIADLEQKKLDNQLSKLKIFVKAPNWEYFRNQLPENVTSAELCQKQDEFFRTANNYLTKYDGQQLSNAYYSLNQDYMTYVLNKKEQYYKEQQEAAQQALLEMQAQQEYMNQQLIQQQQMQNYIRMQRIQNMGNHAYYSNPLMYDPFW